jgi:hypothetical protein
LLAFRDGQRVPTEFWSTKSTAVIRNDVESRVRRKNVLALWPEAWNWSQTIVWAVWRDEELVALCDLDRRRYAERGAERIRAGLRPAGSEQDLRTLLRSGRITARGHQDGEDAVETVPATDWPEWAGMPLGWTEDEVTFDAGAMRRELTYMPEAERPQNLIADPDWVVGKVERRSRRVSQLRRFRDCQGRRRRWLSFEEIADWCAREPGTVRRDETLRAQAYADLRDAMLAGEFGHGVQSRVLYLQPDPGPAEKRLRLAPEGLRTWLDFYGADNPVIVTEILSRCWLPQDLCRRWYARQGLVWPSAFDPPGAQRAAPVPGKRLSPRSIVATREKSSIADENESNSSLHPPIGLQEKTPCVGRKRAA